MNLYIIKAFDGSVYVLTLNQLQKGLNEGKNYNIISTVYLNLQQIKTQMELDDSGVLTINDKPKINE